MAYEKTSHFHYVSYYSLRHLKLMNFGNSYIRICTVSESEIDVSNILMIFYTLSP